MDRGLGLRIGRLLNGVHGDVERLTPVIDGGFPLPTELPDASFAFPVARRRRVGERGLSGLNGWRYACGTRKRHIRDVDGRESDSSRNREGERHEPNTPAD